VTVGAITIAVRLCSGPNHDLVCELIELIEHNEDDGDYLLPAADSAFRAITSIPARVAER
jgi:hypothetical protein